MSPRTTLLCWALIVLALACACTGCERHTVVTPPAQPAPAPPVVVPVQPGPLVVPVRPWWPLWRPWVRPVVVPVRPLVRPVVVPVRPAHPQPHPQRPAPHCPPRRP